MSRSTDQSQLSSLNICQIFCVSFKRLVTHQRHTNKLKTCCHLLLIRQNKKVLLYSDVCARDVILLKHPGLNSWMEQSTCSKWVNVGNCTKQVSLGERRPILSAVVRLKFVSKNFFSTLHKNKQCMQVPKETNARTQSKSCCYFIHLC